MELPTFPASLLVSDLMITNKTYDAKKQTIAEAVYYGGEKFEAIKKLVLSKRAFENQGSEGGQRMREARLQSANYGAPVAGFIDFLAACVFQSNPSVLFEGPEDRLEYYNEINESLAPVLHSRLIQLIIHGKGYMSLIETEDEDGEMKPEFFGIDYCSVLDWERDDKNDLLWIKTHSIDLVRSSPWLAPDIERNTWTFITEEGIYEYVADRPIINGKPKPWDKKAMASLEPDDGDESEDGLEAVTEICLPTGFCLMDSVLPLVLGLFNREASLDFALDSSAYSFLCLFTKKSLKKIVTSELQGLILNPEDKAEWLSPEGIVFGALRERCEDMRKTLENRIQSAALNLASRDTTGRASGVAKFRDFGPIAILLQFYGEVLKKAIQEHITKLIDLKGDTGNVTFTVMGLDEFDLTAIDTKLHLVTEFLKLPVGQTAAAWAIGDLEQSVLSGAPIETRALARQEAKNRGEIPTGAQKDPQDTQQEGDATDTKDNEVKNEAEGQN